MTKYTLMSVLTAALAFAGNLMGATYTDSAANYPGGWTNESNGGTGFGPWSVVADAQGGFAGHGIWDSAGAGLNMGLAFGYVGKVGYINIDRDFSQALNTGDTFALDFGVNWDSSGGNKGFSLYALDEEVINVNHGSFPGEIYMNGNVALAEFGTNTMRWTFTQEAADQIAVQATGRDGSETFSATVTVANGYGYLGSMRFYSSGLPDTLEDQRQSYFDNLELNQEGTPPPDPLILTFTAGDANPGALGDYEYTLGRIGEVGDDIDLSSDNEDALTVPASVSFETGVDSLTFTAAVVSVTNGAATITATNSATGASATYVVNIQVPTLQVNGPAAAWTNSTKWYTVTRLGMVDDTVNLSSSNTNVLSVPATVDFPSGQNSVSFPAVIGMAGAAQITATNASAASAPFEVTVTETPNVIAHDEAGNYTPATFTNGSNEGLGLGPWNFWNKDAELGDSTAGGGGDLNSTNGYSFRFMGDGSNGWCNASRNLGGALRVGNVLSFTFTYNWDGGGRGVDISSQSGQFANLIDVTPGNVFKVNQQIISTAYSPGAVVNVEITQLAGGIEVYLTRSVTGGVNLAYTTNIVHGEPATSVAMYCGGYTADPIGDNANYAIFMNNLQIAGDERVSLVFSDGTWNPGALGDYEFVIERSGPVGSNIVLSSSNTNAVTVPGSVQFEEGSNTVSFLATVVSLTAGEATLIASNEETGAWAEYEVKPALPVLYIAGPWELTVPGIPAEYTLTREGGVGDDIILSSSDEGVLTVTNSAAFGGGSTSLVFEATPVWFGTATLTASNAASGAFATYDVTVQAPELTITGRDDIWTGGTTETYTITRKGAVPDTIFLGSTNTAVMTVPASVDFQSGSNSLTFEATVLAAGQTRLTANDGGDASTYLDVTVTERPEFDAYDDSSLYEGGVWSNSPAHVTGFSDWTETLSPETNDSYRGKFIGASAIGGINEGGTAFGLYANYTGAQPDPLPEIKVSREFPAPMVSGQTFSVDVAYNYSGGTKGFKLKGDFEGTPYERFELYNSGGDTWSYKLDAGTPVVIWSNYLAGGFMGRVQAICTAPNTFTFSFLRGAEETPVLVEDVVLPGTIDQIEFYNYNGGSGDEENFYFNRMYVTKAPAGPPEIGEIVPGAGGSSFTFDVPAGYTLGAVYGADTVLEDGSWDWELLVENTDYTVSGGQVTILGDTAAHRIIRIGVNPE